MVMPLLIRRFPENENDDEDENDWGQWLLKIGSRENPDIDSAVT
jgi:hypothetical protein